IARRRQGRAAGEGLRGAVWQPGSLRRSRLQEPREGEALKTSLAAVGVILLTLGGSAAVRAQQQGGAARSARDRAPIDLTAYWFSYGTENGRYRMVAPAKGEYRRIPSSRAALPLIDAWDPAADERAGNQCKSYGAGNIMSVPGRLHITWQDA